MKIVKPEPMQPRWFFMGPAIKKPMVQVLLEGFPEDNDRRVSLFKPTSDKLTPFHCFSKHFVSGMLKQFLEPIG